MQVTQAVRRHSPAASQQVQVSMARGKLVAASSYFGSGSRDWGKGGGGGGGGGERGSSLTVQGDFRTAGTEPGWNTLLFSPMNPSNSKRGEV